MNISFILDKRIWENNTPLQWRVFHPHRETTDDVQVNIIRPQTVKPSKSERTTPIYYLPSRNYYYRSTLYTHATWQNTRPIQQTMWHPKNSDWWIDWEETSDLTLNFNCIFRISPLLITWFKPNSIYWKTRSRMLFEETTFMHWNML